MIEPFFGIPQTAMRSGKLKRLSGCAVKVYLALNHESERFCTREVTLTLAKLRELVGGAPNSHIKARNELKRAGLVEFEECGAKGFKYRICDPATERPWPGDPKVRIRYQKKSTKAPDALPVCDEPVRSTAPPKTETDPGVSYQEKSAHSRSSYQSTASPSKPAESPSTHGSDIDFPFGANVSAAPAPLQRKKAPLILSWNAIGSNSDDW